MLRVEGNSMIEEQIRDGDYIVVQAQSTAEDGEMVVALVDGDSATVKKLYREPGNRIRLQPANPTMDPIIVDASRRTHSGDRGRRHPQILTRHGPHRFVASFSRSSASRAAPESRADSATVTASSSDGASSPT